MCIRDRNCSSSPCVVPTVRSYKKGVSGLHGKKYSSAICSVTSPSWPVSYTHLDVYKRQVYNREALVARLFAAGYVRRSQVDGPGQFSVRGDIVDIYLKYASL